VGTIKGVGRIEQQTFIDTYTKVAFAKLYDRKNALVAADLLNDQVLPFFEQQEIPLLRIVTDRGTEYCGSLHQDEGSQSADQWHLRALPADHSERVLCRCFSQEDLPLARRAASRSG
jgi:hypothetical protein